MNIESDDNLLRLGEIMHVLDWAFDRLAELGPIELAIAADNTSRARLINNLIFRFAEDHLPAESDISVDVVTQQSHFVFPGAKVRIHMATDDSFRIIVNRNVQTSLWNCSDRQSILPGMPDRDVNFYIAYRPDTTFQSVQRVAVGLYEWGEPRELRLIAVDEWRSRMGELRTADPSVDHVSIPVSLKPFTHQGRLGA